MATLTVRDKDRIVFETTGDERAPGLLLLVHGAVFAGLPLNALLHHGVKSASAYPLVLVVALVGLAEIGFALHLLLKSEWLVIDLPRRSYTGRRAVLPWGERWAGSLKEFNHILLRDVPRGRRGRRRRWVVDWVWREQGRRPFRVSGWGRLRSFRLAPSPPANDGLELLRALRAIAADAGLPLVVPERFLDGLGVSDLELDAPPPPYMMAK